MIRIGREIQCLPYAGFFRYTMYCVILSVKYCISSAMHDRNNFQIILVAQLPAVTLKLGTPTQGPEKSLANLSQREQCQPQRRGENM